MREPYSREALAGLAGLLEASGWRVEGGEVVRPAWHARAACRGAGPGAFFPAELGPGATNAYQETAGRYCAGCPVAEQCRQAGRHEAFGLWGGLSPSSRARRRRAA